MADVQRDNGTGNVDSDKDASRNGGSRVICGPLLRYAYIDYETSTWNGSVLLVLSSSPPSSSERTGAPSSAPAAPGPASSDQNQDQDQDQDQGQDQEAPTLHVQPATEGHSNPRSTKLLSENGRTFWRFGISVPLGGEDEDLRVVYRLRIPGSGEGNHKEEKEVEDEDEEKEYAFWVPAKEETMRIVFHSCNGYSLAVKEGRFAGEVLWKDVMRIHADYPFHVMIGGGDQVYSDAVRTEGPLKGWADHLDPHKRAKMEMTDKLEADLDNWYFKNYYDWYSKQPFREVAASIPSLQIFDDHDIIDGFGSYPDKWMRTSIFLGIGKVAWKYYMLFQQHTPPQGEPQEDPSWVIGKDKGPYIQEYSRSICTTLGKRVVFYGLDCRVDRTLERVCYPSTYNLMFERLEREVVQGQTNHLLLLLGVPIAYPRLVWLEKLLGANTFTLIKILDKLLGIFGSVFNKFDGSAELLDDLYDHWCAHPHKKERNTLMGRLQEFAERKKVRVTILSGDVHLAAVGRFFSKESLGIPQNKDPKYMVNIISSAITNAPPPNAVANILDKRNKLHHFDENTDENLMKIFSQNPDGKANRVNQTTLPSRNYCIITEHAGLVEARRRAQETGQANISGGGGGGAEAGTAAAATTGARNEANGEMRENTSKALRQEQQKWETG